MVYRLIFFFSISFIYQQAIYSQKAEDSTKNKLQIIGLWQVNSSIVGSGLGANFQFYKNGKFVYNVSGYSELNPIYNITGQYRVEKEILFLRIEEYKEMVGFKVIESSPAFQSGSFVLHGGKMVIHKQSDSAYSEHEFNVANNLKTSRYFLMNWPSGTIQS